MAGNLLPASPKKILETSISANQFRKLPQSLLEKMHSPQLALSLESPGTLAPLLHRAVTLKSLQ